MTSTAPTSPALAVSCPVCRVQPGQPCRDPIGVTTERHPNRHFAWEDAGRPNLSVPGATVDFPDRKVPPMTTETATAILDVPLPAGADFGDAWEGGSAYRAITGPILGITDSDVIVWASAIQKADGNIDTDVGNETPAVCIDEWDDTQGHVLRVNSDQARELAAALLEAASVLDGWAAR
jgi:hypothetical protein